MSPTAKSVIRFMLRTVAVALPVVAVFVLWYVAVDPYKVVRDYDVYLPDPEAEPVRAGINKGLVTVSNFQKRVDEGHKYNAYIFGSSISCAYDVDHWKELLDSSATVHPYHFDSSGESLASMARKVEWLDRGGHSIDYALVVLDPIVMASDHGSGPASVDPPQLHDGIWETVRYHYLFFRAATNADFFKSWVPGKILNRPFRNGSNLLFEPQPIVYDPLSNQESIPQWDSIISADPDAFYRDHALLPPADGLTVSAPVLTPEKQKALQRIADVFESQHTDYQIIIGPNRRKVALNAVDMDTMRRFSRLGASTISVR